VIKRLTKSNTNTNANTNANAHRAEIAGNDCREQIKREKTARERASGDLKLCNSTNKNIT